MGFWSKLLGKNAQPETDAKTQAMAAMMASNEEKMFLTGLEAAIGLADSGDQRGLLAMRMAMVARSGKTTATFYEPGVVGGRADLLAERYANARSRLLELAKSGALLDDPQSSGELLSAALVTIGGSHNDLEGLAYEVLDVGGPAQAVAFQLLYNEQRCASALRGKK